MKVFVLSDTHFPFQNKQALKKALDIIAKEKPDVVLQVGDVLDAYVFSNYSKKTSVTIKNDVVLGIKQAADMWKNIKSLVPKAKLYQLIGNHDVRLNKRIMERIPELAELYNGLSLLEFPGVKLLKSDRDFLEIDGVVYCHGWLSNSIDHAKFFNKPTVHGHRHKATIQYDTQRLWSMDVGCLVDVKSIPMGYTPSQYSKWTIASGMVENGQPRLFILK